MRAQQNFSFEAPSAPIGHLTSGSFKTALDFEAKVSASFTSLEAAVTDALARSSENTIILGPAIGPGTFTVHKTSISIPHPPPYVVEVEARADVRALCFGAGRSYFPSSPF